jgi:hypothetical protein
MTDQEMKVKFQPSAEHLLQENPSKYSYVTCEHNKQTLNERKQIWALYVKIEQ